MKLKDNPYGEYIIEDGPSEIESDDVAILVPKYNTTKPDAVGAFHPEAKNFCDYWNIEHSKIQYINNKLPKSAHRKNNVAEDLLSKMEKMQQESKEPIAVWVFLCHGYTDGIQFSIRSRHHRHSDEKYEEDYQRFIDIISEHPSPVVVLYACSTGDDPDGDSDTAPGSGDNSFGDTVRDDLCKKGSVYNRVFAHTTAGHTTRNPFIKLLDGDGFTDGQIGGKFIADPGSSEFRKLRKLLATDFRFKVPFMTLNSINKLLK